MRRDWFVAFGVSSAVVGVALTWALGALPTLGLVVVAYFLLCGAVMSVRRWRTTRTAATTWLTTVFLLALSAWQLDSHFGSALALGGLAGTGLWALWVGLAFLLVHLFVGAPTPADHEPPVRGAEGGARA